MLLKPVSFGHQPGQHSVIKWLTKWSQNGHQMVAKWSLILWSPGIPQIMQKWCFCGGPLCRCSNHMVNFNCWVTERALVQCMFNGFLKVRSITSLLSPSLSWERNKWSNRISGGRTDSSRGRKARWGRTRLGLRPGPSRSFRQVLYLRECIPVKPNNINFALRLTNTCLLN